MSHISPSHMTIDLSPASPSTHRNINGFENPLSNPASPTSRRRSQPDVHYNRNSTDYPTRLNRHKRDVPENKDAHTENSHPLQPLLEKDATNPLPPIAGPEIDDLDESTDIPATAEAHPGVDDGLYEPANDDDNGFKDDRSRNGDDHNLHGHEGAQDNQPNSKDDIDYGHHMDRGYNPDDGNQLEKLIVDEVDAGYYGGGFESYPMTPNGFGTRIGPFPYAPEFSPGAIPRTIPDVNVYQQKKNLAQGMMDLALLSANANQLRYVLESSDNHPYYYPSLIFISLSLILQVAVGVGLIWNSRYNVKDEDDICRADKINNYTVMGIFLITIINVFVASFGVANTNGSTTGTPRTNN